MIQIETGSSITKITNRFDALVKVCDSWEISTIRCLIVKVGDRMTYTLVFVNFIIKQNLISYGIT